MRPVPPFSSGTVKMGVDTSCRGAGLSSELSDRSLGLNIVAGTGGGKRIMNAEVKYSPHTFASARHTGECRPLNPLCSHFNSNSDRAFFAHTSAFSPFHSTPRGSRAFYGADIDTLLVCHSKDNLSMSKLGQYKYIYFPREEGHISTLTFHGTLSQTPVFASQCRVACLANQILIYLVAGLSELLTKERSS